MNYYRRYIGDYMRDTAMLSLAEHGAYCLLMDHAYATEAPISADRDEIMRLVRAFTNEERKAVHKVLDRYWVLKDDGYHNPRIDDELAKASIVIEKQKANGALGGRPRKTQTEANEKPKNNPSVIPNETQGETQTISQNNHPPTTNHHTPASNHQPPASNHQPKARSRALARASRLPDLWVLPKTWGDWAMQERKDLTPAKVSAIAEQFRDHWLAAPGQRGVKADWSATWRNWVRREKSGNGSRQSVADANQQAAQEWLNGPAPTEIDVTDTLIEGHRDAA